MTRKTTREENDKLRERILGGGAHKHPGTLNNHVLRLLDDADLCKELERELTLWRLGICPSGELDNCDECAEREGCRFQLAMYVRHQEHAAMLRLVDEAERSGGRIAELEQERDSAIAYRKSRERELGEVIAELDQELAARTGECQRQHTQDGLRCPGTCVQIAEEHEALRDGIRAVIDTRRCADRRCVWGANDPGTNGGCSAEKMHPREIGPYLRALAGELEELLQSEPDDLVCPDCGNRYDGCCRGHLETEDEWYQRVTRGLDPDGLPIGGNER
jgi:hypothetical protein